MVNGKIDHGPGMAGGYWVRRFLLFCASFILALFPYRAFAQNFHGAGESNFLHSIREIENHLSKESFEVFRMRDLRSANNITKLAILKFGRTNFMQVKWKRAPQGGETFNNEPRYEVAAYLFQKLFLNPEEYVVPPTAIRGSPYAQYKSIESAALPTFDNPKLVFYVLQYWLENVDSKNIYDIDRLASDDTYAKFVGNLNIFSYLIRHSDANQGNFLISTIESNPRVYAVDNGIAFASDRSDRGYEWQQLRVERLPAATVARLKMLSPQKIKSALETVAQFEVQYGLPVAVAPTENLAPEKGVRRTDNIIQFGLTRNEIDGIVERLAALLNRVANGKLTLF